MGNVSTKKIGDVQESVGHVQANLGVIFSIFFGVIFILGGIALIIYAFIPTKDKPPCTNDSDCKEGPGDYCDKKFHTCTKGAGKKKKHYAFIIVGIVLILLSVFMVWFSFWWRRYTKKSRTAAQVGGTMLELGMLRDLFH